MIGYVIYPQQFECFLIRELIEKLNSDLIMFTFVWGFRSVLFFREQQTVFLRRGSPAFEKIMTVAEGIEARSTDFSKIETTRTQFWGVKRHFLKNIHGQKTDFWKIEIVIGGIVAQSTDFEKLKHPDMKKSDSNPARTHFAS